MGLKGEQFAEYRRSQIFGDASAGSGRNDQGPVDISEEGHEGERFKFEGENLPEHKTTLHKLSVETEELNKQLIELQFQIEKKKRLSEAVYHIPVLFDGDDFFEVERHLELLREAGIEHIKIGDRNYAVGELGAIVKQVVEFSAQIHNGELKDNPGIIETFLSGMGVTRQKISRFSKQGFRDCMKACIAGDDRAIAIGRAS